MIQTLLDAVPSQLQGAKVGPGDDAAVLPSGTAITVDTLVEGVHFNRRLSAEHVGYKAVAVSVSDLAAMGALPEWMLLSLSLPQPIDDPWVTGFTRGVAAAANKWRVALQGGDTTRSPGPVVVSVTMGGQCVDKPLRRDAGRPGQQIWVTGSPGLAAGGYALRQPPEACLAALRRPDPPLYFALDLARLRLASATMDLSDGLRADLLRLCRASRTGAVVDPTMLDQHPALDDAPDPMQLMLAGGDDYELLFASDPENADALRDLAEERGVQLTRIGTLTADGRIQLKGMAWPTPPFSHFGSST